MKEKLIKWIGIAALIILFIVVVVTSIVISQKRQDLDDIPDVAAITCLS